MCINSPGGHVTSGLAMYDTMQFIRPPIATLCCGQAASMGSLLLAAGTAGMRRSLPNSRIMVHQPSGGFQGQASDIERHALDIQKTKQRLNEIYQTHTKQPIEEIVKKLDRDTFMAPAEAKDFGLIDEVIEKRPVAEESNPAAPKKGRVMLPQAPPLTAWKAPRGSTFSSTPGDSPLKRRTAGSYGQSAQKP